MTSESNGFVSRDCSAGAGQRLSKRAGCVCRRNPYETDR